LYGNNVRVNFLPGCCAGSLQQGRGVLREQYRYEVSGHAHAKRGCGARALSGNAATLAGAERYGCCKPKAARPVRFPQTVLPRSTSLPSPYGGFLRGEFQVGETAIVNGASGYFGSAAVLIALAMGAARVVAAGHDRAALESRITNHA